MKCKTGIIETIFLSSSAHTGVTSWNPTVDRHRTLSEIHQDNLSIPHLITAHSFNKAAGSNSAWQQKITLHAHSNHLSGTAGQQFSENRVRQKVGFSANLKTILILSFK